jgi:hypothetical protein
MIKGGLQPKKPEDLAQKKKKIDKLNESRLTCQEN